MLKFENNWFFRMWLHNIYPLLTQLWIIFTIIPSFYDRSFTLKYVCILHNCICILLVLFFLLFCKKKKLLLMLTYLRVYYSHTKHYTNIQLTCLLICNDWSHSSESTRSTWLTIYVISFYLIFFCSFIKQKALNLLKSASCLCLFFVFVFFFAVNYVWFNHMFN